MSDFNSNPNQRRRRRRGGSSNSNGYSRPPRSSAAQPTLLQKFLNVISFGLLGKTEALPQVAPRQASAQGRSASAQGGRPPREPQGRRQPRPSSPDEVTSERLYVGNLSYDASESDLFELFNGVGAVRNAEVVVNSRTQRSKGFAFVTMSSMEEAQRAVAELHGKEFMGRPLQISGAKPLGSDQREEGAESREEASA